jgi:hypothetical protein
MKRTAFESPRAYDAIRLGLVVGALVDGLVGYLWSGSFWGAYLGGVLGVAHATVLMGAGVAAERLDHE